MAECGIGEFPELLRPELAFSCSHRYQLVPAVDAELGVDPLQVSLDGAYRKVQLPGSARVGRSGGYQGGYPFFLCAQGPGFRAAPQASSCHLELVVRQAGQPASTRLLSDLGGLGEHGPRASGLPSPTQEPAVGQGRSP